MNEEEQKAIKIEIVNSLKEWCKIHSIVKDRCHAKLTYNEVYLLLDLIKQLQKANSELKNELDNSRKANEYKKEIEQLHEQIDKMNSFMNDTIIEESEVKNENTEENQKKE